MEAHKCRICLEKNTENIFLFDKYRNEYNIVDIVYELTALQVRIDNCLTFILVQLQMSY